MLIRALRSYLPTLFFCGIFLSTVPCKADIRLPALISDNMVLQQKTKATVWGAADPNEKITVKIAEVSQNITASADGHWALKLPPLKAGGPFEMTISGRNRIVIHNVLVGEVWVCSGQSNMEWPVNGAKDAQSEIDAAKFPKIRMFAVEKKVSSTPESTCEGKWVICDPSTVAAFSAVGYFFGRDLYNALKTPVGLITSASGATSAEDWIPKEGFESDPNLRSVAAVQDVDPAMAKEEYKRRYADWVAESEKAKAENGTVPPEPAAPKIAAQPHPSSTSFNGMISPLLPYSIRGVIWYQGESNTRNAPLYRKLFPALIQSWRRSWGEGDFPFLYVQLPNYLLKKTLPTNSSWAELREAQLMTLKIPKTAMAVTIDIGEDNLHPANKQDVGARLALAARANVYGEGITASGPIFNSSKIDGNKIILSFKQVAGGLVAKGGEPLKGFAIAGDDKKFMWADAEIDGDKVIVHSDEVPKPVAVRYAWADNPYSNLCNKADLPASPFRTDDW